MADSSDSQQSIEDDEHDEYEYEHFEQEDEAGSGFSDFFAGLQLMEQITKIEESACEKGFAFNEDMFYQNLAALNMFVNEEDDETEEEMSNIKVRSQQHERKTLWRCDKCELLNYHNQLRCKACYRFCNIVRDIFKGEILIIFVSYLDAATLINLHFCGSIIDMDN